MKTLDTALVNEITDRLVKEFQPEKIVLFGSHAWGTPNENSDLDLMVIVKHSQIRSIRRAQIAYRCLRGISIPMDILVKTEAEFSRYRNVHASLECQIAEKGKVLYGK